MRVVFYVDYPLSWAKGGHAVQIMETKKCLEELGVEILWLHHEDLIEQEADVLHYWSLPPNDMHWKLARARGLKIVISTLHQQSVLRPKWSWGLRRLMTPFAEMMLGHGLFGLLGHEVYSNCDAAIAVTPYEREYMIKALGAKRSETFYVPNGIDSMLFDREMPQIQFDGLTYVGYISERKNSLEVAKAAKRANVPIRFIGGPAFKNDPYFMNFKKEVDNRAVFWEGEVTDKKQLVSYIKGSKGLVLASKNEAVGLVVLDALAVGKPVLLSDLPNLRQYFGPNVTYCSQPTGKKFIIELEDFFKNPPRRAMDKSFLLTWMAVAKLIKGIYDRVLASA